MSIHYTSKGQPYKIMANGRARFLKKGSRSRNKKRRVSSMGKKKKSYSSKASSMLGSLNKPVIGAAGVIAYERFISPMIPLEGMSKDLLELVGGLYLSKKGGIIGATGKTLVVLNAYQLLGRAANMVMPSSGSTSTTGNSW